MVGAMTPRQKAETARKYDVRVQRLLQQFSWNQSNNKLYSGVEFVRERVTNFVIKPTSVVCDATDDDPGEFERASIHDDGSSAASELDAACWRFNSPAPPVYVSSDADESCEQPLLHW